MAKSRAHSTLPKVCNNYHNYSAVNTRAKIPVDHRRLAVGMELNKQTCVLCAGVVVVSAAAATGTYLQFKCCVDAYT